MALVVAVVLGLSFLSSCSAAAVTTQTTTVAAVVATTMVAVANLKSIQQNTGWPNSHPVLICITKKPDKTSGFMYAISCYC